MQSPKPQDTVWLVSFADDDDRELTAAEIATALAAGEIVLTTIVWRDGMADWKPIVEVPELRNVVQKQRVVRPRSTVMGGFGSPAAPPAALSPRPPAAAVPAAAVPPAPLPPTMTPLPTPSVPIGRPREAEASRAPLAPTPAPPFGRAQEGTPRGSLAAGLAAPRPNVSKANEVARPRQEENRTTLTGPGGPAPAAELETDLELLSDAEPISLVPESLESLESEELQSLVDEAPPEPTAPPIFELELSRPVREVPATERETPVPPRALARARGLSREDDAVSPPTPALVTTSLAPTHSRGPAAPAPPRKVHTPVPQAADPLADLEETPERTKKGGGVGKFLLVALVLAGIGGAFYLGQKSAHEAAAPTPSVVIQAPTVVTVVTTVPAPAASSDAPVATEAATETEPPEPAAQGDDTPTSARPTTPSRASSQGSDDRNAELSREPSLDDPAPMPKPVTAPKPEPEEEAAATGPFDKDAAAAALAGAASAAGACRTAGDPSGVAQVSVTFSPSGRATRAIVDGPPFAGTATGGCIASKMTQAKVPAFTGSRVTVKKKVVIQ